MSKHTPEPWTYSFPNVNGEQFRDTDCQISKGGFLIANVSHGSIFPVEPFGSEVREDNARRIVACVNALAGLTTEQIEDGAFAKMRDDRDFLLKQNAELLAALELSVQLMDHFGEAYGCGPSNYIEYKTAKAAIAKAKGGAA